MTLARHLDHRDGARRLLALPLLEHGGGARRLLVPPLLDLVPPLLDFCRTPKELLSV